MPRTQFQQEWTKDLWFQQQQQKKLDFYIYTLSKCDAWLCKSLLILNWFCQKVNSLK